MKYIFSLLLFLMVPCHAYDLDEFEKFKSHVDELIDSQQYEEAARILAERDNIHISKGYRVLSTFIRFNDGVKDKERLIEKYIHKGCKTGDFHSCRLYANILVEKGEYEKAKDIYLNLIDKYSDHRSVIALAYLYYNRDWDGFSEEKGNYWRFKMPEYVKKQSNNAAQTDAAEPRGLP